MNNSCIEIAGENLDNLAAEYFTSMCGFNRNREKYKQMLADGMTVREKMKDMISVKSVVSAYESSVIKGRTIKLAEASFECNALELIDAGSIHRVYAYILTAGNIELQEPSMLESFYADAWGTAYVDAGRDILQAHILNSYISDCHEKSGKSEEIVMTDSFGPGFYGMGIADLKRFFEVMDSSKINVRINESGMLLPLKSCAGFYLVVDEAARLPETECKACIGNSKGCGFCKVKTRGGRING